MKKRIFISYCHQDEKWKTLLVTHLKVLEDQLEVWEDSQIQAGDQWLNKIETAMNDAHAAILLVSAEFFNSGFIKGVEVPALFKRREKEGMKIFPLIVKSCAWAEIEWLNPIQARPVDAKPLAGRRNHTIDAILTEFAVEIKNILEHASQTGSGPDRMEAAPEPGNIFLAKMPVTSGLLLGRKKELKVLDKAWQDTRTHVLTLVAWGGVGKTALVNQWLNSMEKHRFRGAKRVYAWSFYSQGTSVDRQTSADEFIDHALIWFGDPDPKIGSAWDKGLRLANRVRQTKTLLILDGMEPLQYPPGQMQGRLKDQALQALLKELARSQPGLCVVTTRIPVQDIEFAENTSVKRVCLEHLTPETGAALLKRHGVTGTDDELAAVSTEFKGHALALNLLGRYLAVVHDGEIRKKDLVPGLTAEEKDGGHAKRVMESYERFLSGQPELNILYMLGLFDRPADRGAIDALRGGAAIDGLTTELQTLSDAEWKYALRHLRDLNLLAGDEREGSDVLDCHPLVREHFGERFERKHPEAWKEAHNRLYEYYKNLPEKDLPDTLKEMEPLFIAVFHGCRAGRHQEALEDVYWKRISRGDEAYSTKKLGALGSELAALSGFFDVLWSQPASGLTEGAKGFILNEAAFDLRALGRLREAAQPMEAAVEAGVEQENWKAAAIRASNLSELYLTLGEVRRAVEAARKSVALADKSGDAFQKYARRTTLADALHQAGETTQAGTLFRQAEDMQKKHTPQYPFLYSLQGFRYCDLLLGHGRQEPGAPGGRYGEVQKRAEHGLKVAKEAGLSLLTHALDHLSLGRAHWRQVLAQGGGGAGDFTSALDYLHRAVDGLRESDNQDDLPRGLLARAAVFRTSKQFQRARQDLEEAHDIAQRGSMKLFLADYHLEAARVCIEEKNGHWSSVNGHWEKMLEHLNTAKKMIKEMQYHRRDPEIEELEENIKN